MAGWIGRIAAVGCLVVGTLPARADYLVSPGDILDFAVAGIASLHRRLPVDIDGTATFPLAGRVAVAGRSTGEIQEELRRLVPRKSLTLRAADGSEAVSVVDGSEVTVAVAEYRPVYVGGDVAKPGSQPFRPGMTAQQAVTLAGGYDFLQIEGAGNPILNYAALRADYVTFWTSLAAATAQIARIRTELGEANGVRREDLASLPIPAETAAELVGLEERKLRVRNVQFTRDRALQQRLIQAADAKLTFLEKRKAAQQENAGIDAGEEARLEDQNERGISTITRLVAQRRIGRITSNEAMSVGARAEDARKERDIAQRSFDALEEGRRLDLLGELQQATAAQAAERATLAALSKKLLYVGALRDRQLGRPAGTATLTVSRLGPSGPTTVPADDGTVLEPGDSVSVRVGIEADVRALAASATPKPLPHVR